MVPGENKKYFYIKVPRPITSPYVISEENVGLKAVGLARSMLLDGRQVTLRSTCSRTWFEVVGDVKTISTHDTIMQ